MEEMEKAAPPQGQPAYGGMRSSKAHIREAGRRLDKIEQVLLAHNSLLYFCGAIVMEGWDGLSSVMVTA